MARILRGVKSPSALPVGGVVCFPFFLPSGLPWAVHLCRPFPCLPVGHFWPWGMGIFRTLQFLAFLGLCFGLCGLFSCRVWVSLGAVAFGALWGFLRLLFFLPACRVYLQREKSPFALVFCLACLPCLVSIFAGPAVSVCPCVVSSWEGTKEKRPFVGRFSLGGGVCFLLLSK